jgi:hypothetical protein
MADIQDIRAQLREIRHQPVSSASDGNLAFYLVAGLAVAAGFGIVLFTPKIFSVQRTASLPVFHESISREAAVPVQNAAVTPSADQPAGVSDYAGKGADEVATIADAVCARTAQTRPNGSPGRQNTDFSAATIPHENEKLNCFLSEGPARFCAANQSRKAAADVINYFKGIEYANAAAAITAKLTGAPARIPGVEAPPGAKLAPDPRVMVAVEGLMKAGYLSRAQREEIGANVPPEVRHRFALVVANASPCPKPPWWAVWK